MIVAAKRAVGTTINGFKILAYCGPVGNNHVVLSKCPCGAVARRHFSNISKQRYCTKCHPRNHKHGFAKIPEYKVWTAMKQRCLNPKDAGYLRYGGRGITVARRWLTFDKFIADLGRRPSANHTLERKNVNMGYCPSNVVWAPRSVQGNNRTDNRMITWRGVTRTVGQWARHINITVSGLRRRLARMPIEKAMTMPVAGGRRLRKVRFSPVESDWVRVMKALRVAQMCGGSRKEGECPVCAGKDGIHLPYCIVGRVLEEFGYRALLKRGLRAPHGAYAG